MSRIRRTQQFRNNIIEEYLNDIIYFYEKFTLISKDCKNRLIQGKIDKYFKYFYKNRELVEILDNYGLISWRNLSSYIELKHIDFYPDKKWSWFSMSMNLNLTIEL